ncbi:hypothetical protein HDU76_011118, partial [Blyttiomyces sp. JEL0837]
LCLMDGSALTWAFQRVVSWVSDDLRWESTADANQVMSSTVFTASEVINGRRHYFAINVMDGSILVNGLPPSGLPQEIRSCKLYCKHFGERDFEVAMIDGEIEVATGKEYQLLDINTVTTWDDVINRGILPRTDIGSQATGGVQVPVERHEWASWAMLPLRLQLLYSHWYSTVDGVMLFRPIKYDDKNVDFVGRRVRPEGGKAIGFELTQVSYFDRSEAWRDASIPRDRIINVEDSGIVNVLMRIEHKYLIHVLETPAGNTKFNLPRFSLNFELAPNSDVITSLEFNGFCLCANQVLSGYFPRFFSYLLLRAISQSDGTRRDRKVLIPDGEVMLIDGQVRINSSADANKPLMVHEYDLHPVLMTFSAHTVASRLHLATIFAASGSMVPSCVTKMTGSEAAMILVRQCWVNRPLSSDETVKLINLM